MVSILRLPPISLSCSFMVSISSLCSFLLARRVPHSNLYTCSASIQPTIYPMRSGVSFFIFQRLHFHT